MAKQDEGLFLLEVLIDKIIFKKSPCFSDKDFRTCVNIECSAVEPLEICDDDPGVCIAKSGGPFVKSFNTGKSCLFSLKEGDISKAMSKFPIKVSVIKSLPCGCLPTKIVMGEATIDMTKEFVQARKKFLEDPNTVSYQALKDSFRFIAPDGEEAGEIVMFLRISCFGKLIVTRFQGSGGPPSLGTGGGGNAVLDRSCNPKKDFQTTDDPCACGAARAGGGAGGSGGGRSGSCPIARDPYNSMPCQDPDDPCFCSGPKPPGKQQMECRNTDPYCLHVPKDCCPTGNKVIFQLPSDSCGMGHKQRAFFNFTSDGVGDLSRDEPGHLWEKTAEDYPGVVYDFPKQVIKLRIGKTVEMPNRKSTLEYQFITPVVNYEKVVQVTDTRTAQCVPRCLDCCPARLARRSLQSLPVYQNLSEEQKNDILNTCNDVKNSCDELITNLKPLKSVSQATVIVQQCLNTFIENMTLTTRPPRIDSILTECFSSSLLSTLRSRSRSSFIDTSNCVSQADSQCLLRKNYESFTFGKHETTVFMTLYNNPNQRHSSTQATASINKCLQVLGVFQDENHHFCHNHSGINSNYSSTFSVPKKLNKNSIDTFSDVYFYGNKQEPKSGMGNSGAKYQSKLTSITAAPAKIENSKSKDAKSATPVKNDGKKGKDTSSTQSKSSTSVKTSKTSTSVKTSKTEEDKKKKDAKNATNSKSATPVKNERDKNKGTSSTQAKSESSQTNKSQGSSAGTSTGKAVSIKDDKDPCPAAQGSTKGDMSATISHIRIGPKDSCPVHGHSPCLGPKCIVASDDGQAAPVKVSTVTNPRRGVFELVVRRLNGAPLAKNELMLEWTPPPSRPPCGGPCPIPCPTPCRPSKCKMIVCRPSKPKCCKKKCKKPCGPAPCCSTTCQKCSKPSCCGKPCRPKRPCCLPPPKCRPCTPCKPCPPSICWPCPPSSCLPCPPKPCCGPSPCRPCPPRSKCKPSCRRCKPSPCRACSPSPRCRSCRPPRVCRSPRFCRGTPISPCKSCRKCSPCPPSPCRPCPPSPCRPCPSPCEPCPPTPCTLPCSHPCCKFPCSLPCSSSPCLRPCPVGRQKKPRKCKSQPRIKTNKKLISPCWNRSKTCPIVRCQSVPAPPCFTCCIASCPPPKFCKLPPRSCKSSCSSGCG